MLAICAVQNSCSSAHLPRLYSRILKKAVAVLAAFLYPFIMSDQQVGSIASLEEPLATKNRIGSEGVAGKSGRFNATVRAALLVAPLLFALTALAQNIGDEAGMLITQPTPAPESVVPTAPIAQPVVPSAPPVATPPTRKSSTPPTRTATQIPIVSPDLNTSPDTPDAGADATSSVGTEFSPAQSAPIAPTASPSEAETTGGATPAAGPNAPLSAGPNAPPSKTRTQTLFIDMTPTAASDAKVFDESGLNGAKTARDRRYSVPLLFAPEDNGFELGRPQIRWDLGTGKEAVLTGLRVKASDIGFVLTQSPRKEKGSLISLFARHDDRPFVTNISFRWPQIFASTGTFSLEDETGKALWTQPILAGDRGQWRNYLKSKTAIGSADTHAHANSAWGVNDIDPKQYPFLFKRLALRACLTKLAEQDQKLRICTGAFYLTPYKDGHVSYSEASPVAATALLEGKNVGVRGLVNFPENKKINFGIRFASGSEITITSQAIHLKIYDVVESPSGRTVLLTGEGAQPVGRVKMLKTPEIHFWSGTIIKQERIWQLAIPKEAPVVKVLGSFNMPFDLLFDAKRLPKEADRLYLADRQTQTYSRLPRLYGSGSASVAVSSAEFTAKKTSAENFEWEFLADHQSDNNRARIKLVEKDGTPWVAHYDMFRSYASEFSGHFTGVLSASGQAVAMGELSAFHWFEDLGVTDNKTFALQHWGFDVRYFKAFSAFELAQGISVNNFDQLSFNLRYNLTRGIWNRDEIFGIMLSGQHLDFSTLSASLIGPGVYWARTMPKLLDDTFNLLPFLRYPKYLEAEFSYVLFAISPHTKAGATYNLNFRGKVFWRQSLFGEAGFGIKQLQFTDTSASQQAAFTTAFGLIGVGLLF